MKYLKLRKNHKTRTALNVILSNCTKPRTGQPLWVWRKYLTRLGIMLNFEGI